VANFLGQSNLIKGTITGNDGDSIIADLYGQKISLPKNRSHAVDNSMYAGIRPEKFRISLLMVFEQNDDGVAPFNKGDAVNISWAPVFTFALRGDEDVTAGSEVNPEDLDEE
jgi:spermidine/putrescine transport system ATP-binding protein